MDYELSIGSKTHPCGGCVFKSLLTKRRGGDILRASQIRDVYGMAFDQKKYIDEFNKENYDRISIRVPKGKKDELTKLAKQKGGRSVNSLIIEALESYYGIDLSKFGY